ncbi:ParB/RepB/Spo0J family partition protein [Roseomonas frigidaquae]|uniref:ParB/RepB/Spo0J family partition protein n=1 Tax=Falsiroseomonas frigidaquae TaxID=487318 RepID=A0ABX1EZT7_9PROT|nr:ParB/RepB/Spo0J family partition protein [Falsiroseomonas frigidaquae]NKE45594.1 ParB/RepB/Spo0J family partition protein [Falsiroseomonas frigidaquae]
MSSTTRKPTSRLGRGLSALIPDAPPTPVGEALRTVPVEALEPGPFQPRGGMDRASLDELASSIREHGILQPILVRPKAGSPDSYEIIGGERRWRAAQAAQLHEVPVVIRDLGDREAMAAGLVENLQRQDLNALEEAEGYKRLLDEFGLTQEHLGQSVGKSRSHVANTLRLLNLPGPVRDLVRNGVLTAGHARALIGTADPGRLAAQVVSRGLNVRQTEALAAAKPKPEATPPRPQDPETRALERDLTERLGLQVLVRHAGKGGEVVVRYRDLDQLDGLVRLLNGGG